MKILIADQEPLARQQLRGIINQFEHFTVLASEADNGQDAIDLCHQHQPDIVLMDIPMPVMGGLEAARRIGTMEQPPAVIFCTDGDEHALAAFHAQAVGYLLKPVVPAALVQALQRASRLNRAQLSWLNQQPPGPEGHIAARTVRGLELIPLHDVLYFMADNKYVTVHHRHGEVLIDDSLKTLEQSHAQHFVRIHRNALVRRDAIESLSRDEQGQSFIHLRELPGALAVSRRHVPTLRRMMRSI